MTLFSQRELVIKRRRRVDRDRPRSRVPTGAPRLGESSAERDARLHTEAWTDLLGAIRRSAEARLDLLKSRDAGDSISCPWERIMPCDGSCRCGGSGMVTVEFLRGHYSHLTTEISRLVGRPS